MVSAGSSIGTMSQFPVGFDESNDLFDFIVEEFNIILGMPSVGDTSGQNKPISQHTVHFNNTTDVLTRYTFSVCFLKWGDVTLEYIGVIKVSNAHRVKEFRGQNHHHFKKFNDPEQAHANRPLKLSNQMQH
ncbi:CACTA en-spm transposon protein [Cucumis melo var. makuwa]|uniref:CACTA en-spm transposon protein n=1 Tax=Cucumis melo var. makuwa TaxID=1194695 RepID=A0A5D3DCM7_CUCMM|nr:CACTA en-spm transposon protein [Cucumis melo var. makuwa]TYK21407.1 CACTA en-spm transposon protein [Cucumis melo var. makuwa]